MSKTVGFPMIRNYSGDPRDFIPDLFAFMDRYEGVEFYLEKGYGSRLGYSEDDYYKASGKVHFVSREEAFGQDITMILKNPDLNDLEMLKDGSIYFSMLHYATRPLFCELAERKNLRTFSMDSVVDDSGLRLFVDYFGTAFNACAAGVEALKEVYPDFHSTERGPIKALVMGVGGVGQNCIRSLEILSDREFLGKEESGILPIICTRTITGHPELFDSIIKECHLVVDATQRPDATKYVMTNRQVGLLPKDAVILDVCADPYNFKTDPPQVKGIEGTLLGLPGHTVIYPDDPEYSMFEGTSIDATNRRVNVSCNAWPGVDTKRSVQIYYGLMKNYVGLILTKEYDDIHEDSDNMFERALYRSKLSYFNEHNK